MASFLSYSLTVQVSKDPDSFGKGNIQGVIAPEAAINAKDSSSLIPTIAFGIPGGAEMAVFLGILVLHGLQPGPLMLINNQKEIYSLIWSLTAACVLAGVLGLLFVRPLSMVTLVPAKKLAPIVLTIAFIGSWAVDQTVQNLLVSAAFALVGYAMARLDYPRLPVVISIVLGAGMERNFHQSMAMSDGSWGIFFSRGICVALMAFIVGALLLTPMRSLLAKMFPRPVAYPQARARSEVVSRPT